MVAVNNHQHDEDKEVEMVAASGENGSSSITTSSTPLPANNELITSIPLSISHHSTEPPPIYKDVVICGNGPSGISLSFFLAGNWPYYNGLGESVNEMLHYRLLSSTAGNKQHSSIVEQDLTFLAQGLEGRSNNPVALLFDTLNHPHADLGLELEPLLHWDFDSRKAIDHVVIGKGQPGGAWQAMDGSVLTISLGCWMELPSLNFREWEASQESRCARESRASVSSVARYYTEYVRINNLQKYFLNDSVVTSVTQIPLSYARLPESNNSTCDNNSVNSSDNDERTFRRHTVSEIPINANNRKSLVRRNRPIWQVKGYTIEKDTNKIHPFHYHTKNLVLATGSSDLSNMLNVPGEHLPFVLHSLTDLERLIERGTIDQFSDPVLVVGAGLSAADAIILARFFSVPVVHIFRRALDDKNLIFRQLPENMYPEYHKVFQMMNDPSGYDGYKAFEEHTVVEIRPDRIVRIAGPLACGIFKVSYIVICIGSHPDLTFLNGLEKNLGVYPSTPIECKRNPVAIDFSSHESVRVPGLHALGPLVGENFVRFLQGGSLAVCNNLVKQKLSS